MFSVFLVFSVSLFSSNYWDSDVNTVKTVNTVNTENTKWHVITNDYVPLPLVYKIKLTYVLN